MWELIRANRRKSLILFASMGACLLALGFFIGTAVFGQEGALYGVLTVGALWTVLSLVSLTSSASILLSSSHAQEISRDIHPELFDVVEEMKIAAGLSAMPKIYIIDEPALNAFSTGTSRDKSAIAVTAGLLSHLNRDELQGVIAHEMSHILNEDVCYMTMAAVMLGSIQLLAQIFLRSRLYGVRVRSNRSERSGAAGGIAMLLAILFAVLGPILVSILYFSLSRKREYLADACGARLTRYPEGLASALEKLSLASTATKLSTANAVTAPMYIAEAADNDPGASQEGNGFRNFLNMGIGETHPPIQERIQILRAMSGGASYSAYQKAFSFVSGKASNILPPSALSEQQAVPFREPVAPQPKADTVSAARKTVDLMRAVNQYAFAACACGLKFKVPPDYKEEQIECPRCHRPVIIPKSADLDSTYEKKTTNHFIWALILIFISFFIYAAIHR